MQKKDLENIIISQEIKELIKDVDNFIEKKDQFVDSMKKVFLNTSNNN